MSAGLERSGVWYCRAHGGTCNEDEPHEDGADFCSWRDDSQMSYEQNGDIIDACDWTELLFEPAPAKPGEFPPLPYKEWGDIPAGHELRWVPTGGEWRVVAPDEQRPCRWTVGPKHTSCKQPSVAKLDRAFWKHRGDKPNWWHYCEEHLYGRVIVASTIYSAALREIAEPPEHVAPIVPIGQRASDERDA